MEIRIARLRENQVEDAASLLARAFHDQPFERFYEPDAERRMCLLHEVFLRLVRYCFAYGEPYVSEDEVTGVALWMPSHVTHMTPEQEREFGLDQTPEIFGETAFARSRPLGDLLNELHERDMKEPHWYLPILGVDPSRQGTGVGGALLRVGFARADGGRLPCYLDTAQPRNVSFYERHGFKVLTQGVEPVSALPYWTFRRDPATVSR
jgi:GNAT superfamily N-acetyltransferase